MDASSGQRAAVTGLGAGVVDVQAACKIVDGCRLTRRKNVGSSLFGRKHLRLRRLLPLLPRLIRDELLYCAIGGFRTRFVAPNQEEGLDQQTPCNWHYFDCFHMVL